MITFRGWLAKAARVVKGVDPVPNWHICVQGSRCRTVNASRKYSAIGAFRSFSRPAHRRKLNTGSGTKIVTLVTYSYGESRDIVIAIS